MSTNKTEHYGLHLWEPEDAFVRAEFNENSEKVDAAIQAAKNRAEQVDQRVDGVSAALEPMGYNIYSLVLQNYYDSKQTGYKRALIYDGFRDGSMVASLSGGLQRGSGLMTLQGTGMGNIDLGYGEPGGMSENTGNITATGNGTLTGFTYKTYSDVFYVTQLIVNYALTLNGAVAASGKSTFNNVPGQTTVTRNLSFNVPVKAGDTFSLDLSTNSGSAHHFLSGGIFRVSSTSGQNGRLTAKTVELPACGGVLGWVRFKNGTVALSVANGEGTELALTEVERRGAVNLQGAACTEAAFRLDAPLPAGDSAILLDAALNGAASMDIYDYGVTLV